jgi:hypothetical protein
VKRHASDNPGASFEDVRAAFPDALQADSPIQFSSLRAVVARLDDVPAAARRRFHVDPEDLVRLSDCMAVVSREWNATNIKNVLARAEQLGYIVVVEPKGQ